MFAPAPQDVSADGLSAGRDLPVRCLAAARARCRSGTARRAAAGSSSRVLGYSRAGAGVLVFSKRDRGPAGRDRRLPASAWAACRRCWSGIARPASTATTVARREAFAAFCGQLQVDWRFCEPADPQAKGAVERLQGYAETNFEPGRRFANELDFQDQLDAWFVKVNARTHKTLRARPVDRLAEELQVMAPLPAAMPDTARRWVDAGPARSASARRHQRLHAWTRRWSAAASRSASISARSRRSRWTPASWPAATPRVFARHRTITALEHARALKAGRDAAARDRGRGPAAGPLRRADRMSRPTTELAHLFRQLKAPAAARALPKLADRARAEEWSFEQFAAALLKTETDSRDSHGGQSPHQGRAVPGAQDARGVRLHLPDAACSARRCCTSASSTSSPARRTSSCSARPAPARPTSRSRSGIRACLAGHRVAFRTATEWVALLADAQRQGRLDARARPPATDPAADRRRGRLHPVRPPGRQPDVHARQPPLRARLADRHQQQALLRPGARSSATTSSPPR